MGRRRRTTSGNPNAKKAKSLPEISADELYYPSDEQENKERVDASEDWISQLPHDILVFILSLLTMKEAGRTCVLSHRWRCLWTYIPHLNFDAQNKLHDLQLTDQNLVKYGREYVKWVNQVIKFYKGPNLETLRIRFSLDSSFQSDVDRWVHFATQWKLKIFELNLSCYFDSGQYCPCSFPELSNGSKEHLPRDIFCSSSSLTTLKLIAVNVTGKVLECFLTNCQLLEVLCVEESHCLVNFKVAGAALKLKQLEVCMCNYLESLEISAPNLESFKYVGPWISMPLKNAPKLLELYFGSDYGLEIIENFFLLSNYASQLQKLVLDLDFSYSESIEFLKWPPLANLKELELKVAAQGHLTLLGFTSLIEACPSLQMFSLKLDYDDAFEGRALAEVKKCPLEHIKVVEITGFVGKPMDLELVRYFLENAIALEKIVLDTRKPEYMGTIFENKQNAWTRAARKCAKKLRSVFFQGVEVTII